MSRHYDGERSQCRLCGREIEWRLVDGRPKPFDTGASPKSHFLTCTEWREMCRKRDEARRAAKDALQGRLF